MRGKDSVTRKVRIINHSYTLTVPKQIVTLMDLDNKIVEVSCDEDKGDILVIYPPTTRRRSRLMKIRPLGGLLKNGDYASYGVTIPSAIVKKLNIKPNMRYKVVIDRKEDGRIILRYTPA